MWFKLFHIIFLFQIITFYSWGEVKEVSVSLSDILALEGIDSGTATKPAISGSGSGASSVANEKTPEELKKELEKAKEDSIRRINNEWGRKFENWIDEIQQIYNAIQQLDSSDITEKSIAEYENRIVILKENVDYEIANKEWKSDEVDSKRHKFFNTCTFALQNLKQKREELPAPAPPEPPGGSGDDGIPWYWIVGLCIAALIAIPMALSQLSSFRMMIQQIRESRKRAKEDEDENIISI